MVIIDAAAAVKVWGDGAVRPPDAIDPLTIAPAAPIKPKHFRRARKPCKKAADRVDPAAPRSTRQ
jgi:hypothetical protein